METMMEVLDSFKGLKNSTIIDNVIKAWTIINNRGFERIGCSISGGSDSDIMLDIVHKCDKDKKVRYFWFDTGLEYQATKDHLEYLEQKYGINIERERAIKSIPLSCKEYGQPFISKEVSSRLETLQNKNFDFKDHDYEYMAKNYGITVAIWWCNKKPRFQINQNKYLKEFLMAYPPTFKISSKCCNYAKKNVADKMAKKHNFDLMIIGVRKAEGGIRASAYKSCFDSESNKGYAKYRPLFWYLNSDKEDYENNQKIIHSNCYRKYGFKRTGCACCPYGHVHQELFKELKVLEKYEPQLYKAVNNVFKDSYEYTKKYYEFRAEMEEKEKQQKGQLTFF